MVQKKTAMDWDDYRIFLAVARTPSIRAAAAKLEVSHSTVLRRIERLEEKLEARLFERRNVGFRLTETGQEVLIGAEEIEESIQDIDRSVTGRDSALHGLVKISMPNAVLHPSQQLDIVAFRRRFPGILLQIDLSYDLVDLRRREADIAVRFIDTPPEDLVAKKIGTVEIAAYATQEYITKYKPLQQDSKAEIIGYGQPTTWTSPSNFEHLNVAGFFDDVLFQVELTKSGLGVGILPSAIADKEPSLVKITDPDSTVDAWVIYHPDLRQTSRVRVVRDFLVEDLRKKLND